MDTDSASDGTQSGEEHWGVVSDNKRLVTRPVETALAAAVANRYFLEGRTRSEIAVELSISRFKVTRLIDWAREVGIVRIQISTPPDLDSELGLKLQRLFGLGAAIVVVGGSIPGPDITAMLGPAAASVIAEVLEPDDVLGLGWGRTIESTVAALPVLRTCPVVELIGVTSTSDAASNSSDIVRRAAARTGGPAFQLPAPFLVADVQLATALRREPLLAPTLAMFPAVTKAVLGIGSWAPAESGYITALPPRDRQKLRRSGAVADFCAAVLDADGKPVDTSLEERTIAMTLAELRRVPTVIAVAGGEGKATAIRAVLRSGLVSILVTDEAAARQLL